MQEVVPPTIKKGVRGPKSLCGKAGGIAYDGHGMAQVVQRLHGIHVYADALLAKQPDKLRVAAAALVTGNIEGNYSHIAQALEGFIYRGVA